MATSELGVWEPLSVAETVEVFRDAPFRWWISGGRALELYAGRTWREHADTDVGVTRSDVARLRPVLADWDIHVACAGRLRSWAGETLRLDRHENNLWCRRQPDAPWSLDVTIGEGDRDCWIYRRDPVVRAPWPDALARSAHGVPYLAPELQLLFKSVEPRDKDHLDAQEVIPALDMSRRVWLARLLPADHPWRRLLLARQ